MALEERRKELEVLHRLSVIALSEHTIDIILQEMVRDLSDVLGFSMVAIELYHEAQKEMELVASIGVPIPSDGLPLKVPVDETPAGIVIQNGQPLVEFGNFEQPEYKFETLRALGVKTFACVPLVFGQRVMGALSMGSPESLSIDKGFVPLVKSIANFITSIIRHMHALEESEAKMRSILENIGIGVALINPEMEILELNRQMREWFPDIDPGQHPVCYRSFNDPPREGVCEYCPSVKTLQDGRVHEAVTQTPRPGGIRNYRLVTSPIFNQDGRIRAVIEITEDITERLSLESQLRQAQKMESVGRLAGGVAHDFNNMLGVILGYGELALEDTDAANPLYNALQEILKAARRSSDITRQLLAFARKQTISPKILDINKTVGEMTKMLQRLMGENIEMAWLPGENVWPLMMDPGQIDQILANLCVNARDAIADVGKVVIETGNAEFDESHCKRYLGFLPGEYVLLAVSDNGCGMDAETQDKIFEPFFTTKEPGTGTGLGLATVYGIVNQNKGFVNVYSEPGQGTTFRIYLPRHRTRGDRLPEKGRPQSVERGHETILLVEDEPTHLGVTTMMLERLGYQVVAAETPDKAIHMAREYNNEIHLLVTDVVMPEMNGRDLARSIQSIQPNLKCLFMSGYTANVIAHHGILDKGLNFLQKPFSKEKLGARVREVLDGKQENSYRESL
jgi:signal transduction histidine kinase/ActR/RegA family two-component response regulator